MQAAPDVSTVPEDQDESRFFTLTAIKYSNIDLAQRGCPAAGKVEAEFIERGYPESFAAALDKGRGPWRRIHEKRSQPMSANSLIFMVGDAGFEPATPAV